MPLLCGVVPREVEGTQDTRSRTRDWVSVSAFYRADNRSPDNIKGRKKLLMPFMSVRITPRGNLRRKTETCHL